MARPRDVGSCVCWRAGLTDAMGPGLGRHAFPPTQFVHLYCATETAPSHRQPRGAVVSARVGIRLVRPSVGVDRHRDRASLQRTARRGQSARHNFMACYWNKPDRLRPRCRDGTVRRCRAATRREGHVLRRRSKDMTSRAARTSTARGRRRCTPTLRSGATVFGLPSAQCADASPRCRRYPLDATESDFDRPLPHAAPATRCRSISFQADALPKPAGQNAQSLAPSPSGQTTRARSCDRAVQSVLGGHPSVSRFATRSGCGSLNAAAGVRLVVGRWQSLRTTRFRVRREVGAVAFGNTSRAGRPVGRRTVCFDRRSPHGAWALSRRSSRPSPHRGVDGAG